MKAGNVCCFALQHLVRVHGKLLGVSVDCPCVSLPEEKNEENDTSTLNQI